MSRLLPLLLIVTSTWAADARWPSFRGEYASGLGEGLPAELALRWKLPIPGLAHSGPVVWDDTVYVTSAVSSEADATFQHGLYGDGDASDDRSVHRFVVTAIDRESGKERWSTTVHEGVPIDKRHIKSTYANSTPATNGEVVVAFFGSEGVFALDTKGKLLWRRELGRLDVGAYNAPDYEWGSASSPVIWKDRIFVQCDTQGEDFLIALDLKSGKTIWKTERDELPSWGTPTIFPDAMRPQLIANGSNWIMGYDPKSGKELWRLGGSSKITAPTPFVVGKRIVVASGRRPERPIFVIDAGAKGDITGSEQVLWTNDQGPYMPTPIVVDGVLYSLNNNGILDAYRFDSGEKLFRQRIEHQGGGFSASPVASGGRIYLSGEDGEIYVLLAGERFEQIETIEVGERLMATPAIARGLLLVRGEHHLFAYGAPAAAPRR